MLDIPINLSYLQGRAQAWREKSFPAEHRTAPLQALGVCEEAGELAHAVLKMEQGIRGTREEHLAAVADACGDIFIYMTGVCSALDINLEIAIKEAWEQVEQRDWSKNKKDGLT